MNKSLLACLTLILSPLAAGQGATTTPAQQLVLLTAQLQKAPADGALRTRILALAPTLNPPPEVPREAVEDEGAADYLFKNAKSQADFAKAADQIDAALLLAPWQADAYYNLGVAREQAGQFDQAEAAFNLYLEAKPNDADTLRRLGAMRIEKQQAQAAANAQQQQQQQDAYQRLQAALAEQNRQAAMAGPWVCSYYCTGGSLQLSGGALSGSLVTKMGTSGGRNVTAFDETVAINASVDGNGAVQGSAQFPGYKEGPCSVPTNEQDVTGTISADGRSLELRTTLVNYTANVGGSLLIPVCTGVTPTGNQTENMRLVSQASNLIPLLSEIVTPAAGTDMLTGVSMLLAHGADIEVRNGMGETALGLAAKAGSHDLVALLLQHGAVVDTADNFGMTPLDEAMISDDTTIVSALLARASVSEISGALYFSTDKNLEASKLLLAHGADVNASSRFGVTPLLAAMSRAIAEHADGNACSALYMEEAREGRKKRRAAAAPDLITVPCQPAVTDDTVGLFLDTKANVNLSDGLGVTPVMWAAESGDLDLVRTLIQHGADLKAKDSNGHNVMDYAKRGKDDSGHLLAWNKESKHSRDAKQADNEAVIKYLESQGAKS